MQVVWASAGEAESGEGGLKGYGRPTWESQSGRQVTG